MTKEKVYYFGAEAYYPDKKNKLLYISLSDDKKFLISFEEARCTYMWMLYDLKRGYN